MIEQAKAAIESEKNGAVCWIKSSSSYFIFEYAEKLLKEELSNKESQTKLVEKLLGT
jgi:F-type H+-transporting ATPase subunit b